MWSSGTAVRGSVRFTSLSNIFSASVAFVEVLNSATRKASQPSEVENLLSWLLSWPRLQIVVCDTVVPLPAAFGENYSQIVIEVSCWKGFWRPISALCDLDLWPPESWPQILIISCLASLTNYTKLHQSRCIHFQNIPFTSLVTEGRINGQPSNIFWPRLLLV